MRREVTEALRVVELIKPALHGRGPEVQGAALAELLSLFIAGHAPELRDQILDAHIRVVRDLVEVNGPKFWKMKGKT